MHRSYVTFCSINTHAPNAIISQQVQHSIKAHHLHTANQQKKQTILQSLPSLMSGPKPPHVAIISSPGVGHLIPMASLAALLARRHGFAVTLVAVLTNHPEAQRPILDSLPKEVTTISISPPPPPIDPPVQQANAETKIFDSLASNLPYLRELLSSTENLKAVVVDSFGTDVFDVAAELGVPAYVFFTSPCMALSSGFHISQHKELPETVRLPGCVPVQKTDLPDPFLHRERAEHSSFLRLVGRYSQAEAILVNSFEDLEPGPIRGLKESKGFGVPPIFPVGPLVWAGPEEPDDGSEILRWLDRQPAGSVMYVSFGSGGTLTWQQTEELAWGLELSGQRFLWVVKSPSDKPNAAYFGGQRVGGASEFLPNGFLDRTAGLGLVVPSWAPQTKVIGHPGTGGFLTHCGWNSSLESIVHGVPMVAWPLHAEQKLNAVLLAEDVKVALRPNAGEGGLVGREEISRIVRCLMEGEEGKLLRTRVRKLADAAVHARGEGGSSFVAMQEVIPKWKGLEERRIFNLH